MKNGNVGIALILFAILLQLCSSGLAVVSLTIGFIGLVDTFAENTKVLKHRMNTKI